MTNRHTPAIASTYKYILSYSYSTVCSTWYCTNFLFWGKCLLPLGHTVLVMPNSKWVHHNGITIGLLKVLRETIFTLPLIFASCQQQEPTCYRSQGQGRAASDTGDILSAFPSVLVVFLSDVIRVGVVWTFINLPWLCVFVSHRAASLSVRWSPHHPLLSPDP